MQRISLNGEWSLRGIHLADTDMPEINIKATVPGCVQLDMSRAGILPADLFMGENIIETEKYEDCEWWYERGFTAPEDISNAYLVFRGVDCAAEYFLNGEKIGESCNMLIPHEFFVGDKLLAGENTLTVHIFSPIERAHAESYDAVSAFSAHAEMASVSMRRAPHSYGWDIMPRAVTSGLWREVTLECRDTLYFKQLFVDTRAKRQLFYEIDSRYEDFRDVEVEFCGECGDSIFKIRKKAKFKSGRINFTINNPKLWWPYGYGDPNLYHATARIYSEGKLVHEMPYTFGLRTVELDRTEITDGYSGRFRFLVNGVEIMCKGTNWVPLDAFHSRDAERYERALDLVSDVGCNIIRCWGGNVYEDHSFFDYCDAHGIMVWQDFSMACNYYPQTEKFADMIRAEAESVVKEYRHHPSIILWSGDNEIDYGTILDGYYPPNNTITRRVLPEVIHRHDIGRPYLASSPYIGDEAYKLYAERGRVSPEAHLWGMRDYHKAEFYKNSIAHFVSETGYHGCPSPESIKKFITPERLWPYRDNPEWTLHSSDQNGSQHRVVLMEYQIRQLFGEVPNDLEGFSRASQICQAEAKKYFIERIRVGRPRKTGIIWWNLLDGWPQFSDAVVDYYFDKKLAYGYIKRAEAPFAICLDELEARVQKVYACNDTLNDVTGSVRIYDADTGETVLERGFTAGKNASTEIGRIFTEYHEHKMLIIEWKTNRGEGFNHYLCGFPPHNLEKYNEWIEKYHL